MSDASIKFLITIVVICCTAIPCGICILVAINRPKKDPKAKCPNCELPFSDWFWWPGKGNYCWPCYKNHGYIIFRKGDQS